ncbi:hypothetical protein OCV73_14220 [Barnesiella propionica]|uniref:hypothetical protein n=1 Tax=Barnesiella propionica TaxID=2981781 RepID=UPI0011CA7188|nr:hypothetical protein [Barnesiella propionica]MCU6770091.1 hypothetical protein [Barnesiella propionica]
MKKNHAFVLLALLIAFTLFGEIKGGFIPYVEFVQINLDKNDSLYTLHRISADSGSIYETRNMPFGSKSDEFLYNGGHELIHNYFSNEKTYTAIGENKGRQFYTDLRTQNFSGLSLYGSYFAIYTKENDSQYAAFAYNDTCIVMIYRFNDKIKVDSVKAIWEDNKFSLEGNVGILPRYIYYPTIENISKTESEDLIIRLHIQDRKTGKRRTIKTYREQTRTYWEGKELVSDRNTQWIGPERLTFMTTWYDHKNDYRTNVTIWMYDVSENKLKIFRRYKPLQLNTGIKSYRIYGDRTYFCTDDEIFYLTPENKRVDIYVTKGREIIEDFTIVR